MKTKPETEGPKSHKSDEKLGTYIVFEPPGFIPNHELFDRPEKRPFGEK